VGLAPAVSLPLPIGSYKLPVPGASTRVLLNCYAQEAPPEKPNEEPVTLIRAPGIAAFGDTAQAEVRGFTQLGDTLFTVAGSKLCSVSSGGTVTLLTGAAISGNGPVRVENNGTDIVVTPGNGDGFTSDGSTVAQITDPDFTTDGGGADVVFLDQYFVFRRPGTARFFNSGLNDTTFNALDIATAEGAPGALNGLIANNRELILTKEKSIERWYDAENSPGSPFSRSPNGFYEIGCRAGESLANQDNSVAMLANDLTFRRLTDIWRRISNHGVESVLQRMEVTSDCFALPYSQEGHLFVAFTFRNAGRTFVVDFTTGEWHERDSIIDTVNIGRWRPQCIIQAYGKQIVGDSASGKLGILDPDTHEEWGEPQRMSWTYQPVVAQRRLVSHRRFELGLSAGQGTATGQGENPLATLFVSDDGGNVYRARPVRSVGRLGEYRKRVQWYNLGSSEQRVYRVDITDPIRMFIIDTQLDATGGR